MQLNVTPEAIKAIKDFQLPQDLAFGKVICPVMVECNYTNGQWEEPKMLPYQPLSLDPTSKVLHYAQEIFEGMKGYRVQGRGPYLFRPNENQKRFRTSAQRMAMVGLPEEIFKVSVESIVSYCADMIPSHSGDSLYIRPFMFATDCHLGIKPSETFKFMVLASPSAAYFSGGSVKVLIERGAVRACPGGVGAAKTGGNYAASLSSMVNAQKLGFDQVLWLDAVEKKYIEEMSGMNFFAVYGEEIITPKLTETILDGITRKSILELAHHIGIKAHEESLKIDDLVQDIKAGKCTEAFACGTAVILTPINGLGEANGKNYPLKHASGPVANKLRQHLLGIQEGKLEDPFGWRQLVECASQL